MRRKAMLACVFLGAVVAACAGQAAPPSATPGKNPKLASSLVAVARVAREAGTARALREARARGLGVVGGRIRVVVEARAGQRPAARTAVTRVRGVVEAESANLVQALLGPGLLETVAKSAAVSYVRPPRLAVPLG